MTCGATGSFFEFPGLARYLRALQADGDRGSVGANPAVFDDGRLHRHFRQIG